MTYLSVCSGIEAASVAWKQLGWQPWAFSEIDRFPSAVLQHHYPTVPNLGDMMEFRTWHEPRTTLDLLVGGTPCQSFSVAGLRKGLDDPRGSLMLVYLAIARRYRPRWLVWENVPGVLSSDDGRAFGSLLGGLAELGYGFAYRILDAQYAGLAQRRARVFVVAHLGDWRRAAAVLFERESLSGHPAPSREAGEVAPTIPSRSSAGGGLGTDFDCDGGLVPERARALTSSNQRMDWETETIIAIQDEATRGNPQSGPGGKGWRNDGVAFTHQADHVQAVCFSAKDSGADCGDLAPTLRAGSHDKSHANAGVMPAIAFAENQRGEVVTNDTMGALKVGGGKPGQGYPAVAFDARQSDVIQYGEKTGPLDTDGHTIGIRTGMQVRRLTPRECERLQGFPDDYTLIPYRGKLAADGPRYKALGNSMAVPCMAWIGRRIQMVEQLLKSRGFDGLYHPDPGMECGCFIGDLRPCGETRTGCRGGHASPDGAGIFGRGSTR